MSLHAVVNFFGMLLATALLLFGMLLATVLLLFRILLTIDLLLFGMLLATVLLPFEIASCDRITSLRDTSSSRFPSASCSSLSLLHSGLLNTS